MGVTGALFGAFLGGRLFGGLGALLGAAIGHSIEKAAKETNATQNGGDSGGGDDDDGPRYGTHRSRTSYRDPNSQMVFCASAAAMLAKMAKADGVVTRSEIDAVEGVFRRLGFSAASRRYAIDVFRRAKDDSHTIYDYAEDFSSVVREVGTRELFYELLWELAAADGEISAEEERMLASITKNLRISGEWYAIFASQYARLRSSRGGSSGYSGGRTSSDPLKKAYETLGVAPTASDDDVKKAYREKAKQYHPDRLRAQGLPEGMIAKANERMAQINSAWSAIKSARNLK